MCAHACRMIPPAALLRPGLLACTSTPWRDVAPHLTLGLEGNRRRGADGGKQLVGAPLLGDKLGQHRTVAQPLRSGHASLRRGRARRRGQMPCGRVDIRESNTQCQNNFGGAGSVSLPGAYLPTHTRRKVELRPTLQPCHLHTCCPPRSPAVQSSRSLLLRTPGCSCLQQGEPCGSR